MADNPTQIERLTRFGRAIEASLAAFADERRVAAAPLDVRQVRAVHARAVREFFLRQTFFFSEGSHGESEPLLNVRFPALFHGEECHASATIQNIDDE